MNRFILASLVVLVLSLLGVAAGREVGTTSTGTSTIDFGSFPGKANATLAVTGLGQVTANSYVTLRVSTRSATADHSTDEHMVESIRLASTALVAGTGFTINAELMTGAAYGQFNVDWEVQ